MTAGGSQAVQAMRSAVSGVFTAKQLDRRSRTGRHVAGCRGERAVCGELSKLALSGHHHLDDLRWRADASNRVNLDHLVIGPTGVFVVDAKLWQGRLEVRGSSVLQDGRARDDRLIALEWLTQRVHDVLASAGVAHRPTPVVCFATPQGKLPPVGRTLLTDVSRVGDVISGRPSVLRSEDVDRLVQLLSVAFPPYDVDPREVAEAEGLLFGDDETRHAGLREALQQPLQEWMVWLHPEQATAVRRSFNGPARIRGAAGTGKTSVALHRIHWLASTRPGRFLVTSYVRTLPPSLAPAYRQLSPRTADRVDFVHLHGVATALLADRGVDTKADVGHSAFTVAWRVEGAALEGTGLSKSYFREEVDSVIKGRDLPTLEAYLDLDRVGRRAPLRADARRAVWALKERYDAELADRGQADMVDLLRLARDAVRTEPCRTWSGVAVDEVQDLPLVGLELLYELAGRDRPDGLLLVGDGQQAIYPGGFRLAEAGINVAARAVVLRTNYRNTVEVLAAARAIVAADRYDDVDVSSDTGERDVQVVRHGDLPTTDIYDSIDNHDAALLWDLQALADRGARWSDMAVLCQTNDTADRYAKLLADAGVPSVLLKSAKAVSADAVKVGTWFRSKGMEFPHVFLPQVDKTTLLLTGAGAKAQDEKAELLRRTLYVAMTRARDTLWVGRVRADSSAA